MRTSIRLDPEMHVRTNLKKTDDVVLLDPVDAYKAGYFDASKSMLDAEMKLVTTLRVAGWDSNDILSALLTALKNYTNGKGLEDTVIDILHMRSGPERTKQNGSESKTIQL